LEERGFERKPCTIAVDYSELDKAFTDYIRDISPSGAFMASHRPFHLGEEVFLRINFPEEQNPFKIPAEVVRTTAEGVGLRFKFKSKVQQEIITSLIENVKEPKTQ
jgi:Tfp pilus assembly protein PilZ